MIWLTFYFAFAFALLCVLIALKSRRKFKFREGIKIPRVSIWTAIRVVTQFYTDLLLPIQTIRKEGGNIAYINVLSENFIVVSNADMIQSFSRDPDRLITKSLQSPAFDALREIFGPSVVSLDSGIAHSHLRRYLVPTLSAGLKQHFDGISGMVNKLLFKLDDIYSERTSENQFVNLNFVMKLLAFDMFGEIAMNYDFGALECCDFMADFPGDKTSTVLLAVDYLSGYTREWALLSSVPLVGSALTIAVRRKIKKALAVIHAFFNEIFERRQSESPRTYNKRHKDILDVLIDAKNEGVMLEKEDVVHHMIAFIFSGCHTISSLLLWTLISITKNKNVEEKIISELISVMGPSGVDVEYQHLDKMTYMNIVLMETMRLYPQFPVVTRQAIDDCVVNGYQFPRGTHVLINCFSLHRDPKYWIKPEEFNPDLHFSEDSVRHPYAYLPYSFGDRKCLGEHLSKFQAKIALSMLLRNFRVELKDNRQTFTPIVHSVLMDVKEDVMVRFVPRLEHGEEG